MTGRRRLILAAAVAVAVLALSAALWGRGLDEPDRGRGGPAPSIELGLVGAPTTTWRLSDQLGTPVLVNFWASWCTPCRLEMPDIDALVASSSGAIQAVGVNILDQGEAAEAFAEEIGVTYPLVRDDSGDTAQAYGVTGVPYTVIVDTEGVIVARASGRPDAAALEQLVVDALGDDWRRPN